MTLQPGDRVEFTEAAHQMFRRAKSTTGKFVRVSPENKHWIVVHRDGIKKRETYSKDFWQLPTPTPTPATNSEMR